MHPSQESRRRWRAAALAALFLAACRWEAERTDVGLNDSADAAHGGRTAPAACVPEPARHRESGECDDYRPSGQYATSETYKPLCQSDADCTEGRNGRCTPYASFFYTDGHSSLRCTYDACTRDADCGAREICHCGENGAENRCLAAGCRVDADCQSGYCSPYTATIGVFPTVEYACRTCLDECVDDSDCKADADAGQQAPRCLWDAAKKRRWTCMRPNIAIE